MSKKLTFLTQKTPVLNSEVLSGTSGIYSIISNDSNINIYSNISLSNNLQNLAVLNNSDFELNNSNITSISGVNIKAGNNSNINIHNIEDITVDTDSNGTTNTIPGPYFNIHEDFSSDFTTIIANQSVPFSKELATNGRNIYFNNSEDSTLFDNMIINVNEYGIVSSIYTGSNESENILSAYTRIDYSDKIYLSDLIPLLPKNLNGYSYTFNLFN